MDPWTRNDRHRQEASPLRNRNSCPFSTGSQKEGGGTIVQTNLLNTPFPGVPAGRLSLRARARRGRALDGSTGGVGDGKALQAQASQIAGLFAIAQRLSASVGIWIKASPPMSPASVLCRACVITSALNAETGFNDVFSISNSAASRTCARRWPRDGLTF